MTRDEHGSTKVQVKAPEARCVNRQNASSSAWRSQIRRAIRACSRPDVWKRGLVLATLALLLGLVMLLHAKITNIGGLGSLVETFLPWFGLLIPALLLGALLRRSPAAILALLLPAVVWLSLFGGLLVDKSHRGGDLIVISHNVGADNPDPAGTARNLADSGAGLLALQELDPQVTDIYEDELAAAYPYHAVRGTVGLWSKLPLSDTEAIDAKLDYGPLADTKPLDAKLADARALRTVVATDQGPLVVYVAHLGSVRVFPRNGFSTASRDRGAQALAQAIAAEHSGRLLLLGDLNGTMDDRAFAGLTSQLDSVQEIAGDGFGFSWPAKFPIARIDQILVKGVDVAGSWTLPATGSDHLPVAAGLKW